jgi:hypothetical protein
MFPHPARRLLAGLCIGAACLLGLSGPALAQVRL